MDLKSQLWGLIHFDNHIDYKENSSLSFIRSELLCIEVSHKLSLKNTTRKYCFWLDYTPQNSYVEVLTHKFTM